MAAQNYDDLDELVSLLAAGLLRVLARKSSAVLSDKVKTLLDCERDTEGDGGRRQKELAP